MITTSSTLFRYLSRHFLYNFFGLLSGLMGIVFIFEAIEFLRRAAKADNVTFGMVLEMSALKLPYMGEVLLPFAILFAAIYTCWKLNKTQELAVIRSAGLSVWQFLSPLVFSAVAIGLLATMLFNPIAATLLSKFNQKDIIYFQKNDNQITVSKTGIWLRQPYDSGYALIHAENLDQADWRMTNVLVYFFDKDDNFQKRIDSPVAYLEEGRWNILDARISDRNGWDKATAFHIPTELTANKIEESFADPDTISFWNIPEFIHIMKETGFPSTRLHIHFHALLARPLLFAAMIFLAASFSLRPPRAGGTATLIALGVFTGFFIFMMEAMLNAFGISAKIPTALAAWTPATVSMLLGITALLHLEDG